MSYNETIINKFEAETTNVAENEKSETIASPSNKISVSLLCFANELAKIWNTDIKNLKTDVLVDTFNGKWSREQMLKELVNKPSSRQSISFLVRYKEGTISFVGCISRPITEESLKAVQKDGKTLASHLKAEISKVADGHYESSIVCDDYRPLIFDYAVSELKNISTDSRNKNVSNIALLNAAKRNNLVEEKQL